MLSLASAASELERAWSRQVVRFIGRAAKAEARMTAEERRTLLDVERTLEQPTKGFYGWGFVDRNPLRRAGGSNITESQIDDADRRDDQKPASGSLSMGLHRKGLGTAIVAQHGPRTRLATPRRRPP